MIIIDFDFLYQTFTALAEFQTIHELDKLYIQLLIYSVLSKSNSPAFEILCAWFLFAVLSTDRLQNTELYTAAIGVIFRELQSIPHKNQWKLIEVLELHHLSWNSLHFLSFPPPCLFCCYYALHNTTMFAVICVIAMIYCFLK